MWQHLSALMAFVLSTAGSFIVDPISPEISRCEWFCFHPGGKQFKDPSREVFITGLPRTQLAFHARPAGCIAADEGARRRCITYLPQKAGNCPNTEAFVSRSIMRTLENSTVNSLTGPRGGIAMFSTASFWSCEYDWIHAHTRYSPLRTT